MMLYTATQLSTPPTTTPSTVVLLANQNIYVNPRLQQGSTGQMENQRSEEVKKVLDILVRTKKMNPVLVGYSEHTNYSEDKIGIRRQGRFAQGIGDLRIPNAKIQMIWTICAIDPKNMDEMY
ncbi:Double Clp-N motif-containing P-loop nucleoside triphosphate hydrolase superfamily protein [Abeliophyllum distichum]|uniref:Double Clp-N motif-containing P-loop nucleoside triphosphate hydrolase superfamily protein n=1 Tax=Abeliophyllum distichum TaxID=126358 RepID=A0ABD1VTC4_9LAMI